MTTSAAVVGAVAAVVIILFLVGIAGFVYYRRRTLQTQKKLLDEYSSQLQMVRGRSRPLSPRASMP